MGRKKRAITASEMGKRSAKARMKKIPPDVRSALARQAARARWAKVKRKKNAKD
jgi:hypothetical protein